MARNHWSAGVIKPGRGPVWLARQFSPSHAHLPCTYGVWSGAGKEVAPFWKQGLQMLINWLSELITHLPLLMWFDFMVMSGDWKVGSGIGKGWGRGRLGEGQDLVCWLDPVPHPCYKGTKLGTVCMVDCCFFKMGIHIVMFYSLYFSEWSVLGLEQLQGQFNIAKSTETLYSFLVPTH